MLSSKQEITQGSGK